MGLLLRKECLSRGLVTCIEMGRRLGPHTSGSEELLLLGARTRGPACTPAPRARIAQAPACSEVACERACVRAYSCVHACVFMLVHACARASYTQRMRACMQVVRTDQRRHIHTHARSHDFQWPNLAERPHPPVCKHPCGERAGPVCPRSSLQRHICSDPSRALALGAATGSPAAVPILGLMHFATWPPP